MRIYESLCRQTCQDFEWLIIDDGSTDDTRALVNSWIKEHRIKIRYIYQENMGKQRAVNTAIMNCSSKYFGFLDSDDYYVDCTVEKFLKYFSSIEKSGKTDVAGVLARRGKDINHPIGSTNIPANPCVINFDKLVRKYGFYGDTCRAYYTDVLRLYLYPEISDKFILESVMLSRIDRKYDLLLVNEVLSISEYLKDGYTINSHKLYKKNPLGYALGIGEITASRRGFCRQVKYTIMYSVWCRKYGISNPYKHVANKVLFILLKPVSYLCYAIKFPRWYFDEE